MIRIMTYDTGNTPPPPQQPTYAPPLAPQQPTGPVVPKGLAISALVVGIVAFCMGLIPVLGAIVGIAAVILGAIALAKKQPKGFALTGLILGALGLITSIGTTAGIGALTSEVSRISSETSISAPPTTEETVEEPVTEEAEPEPEPQFTIGQKNAIRSAESYIDLMPFSRTGLIEQLEFEGYSLEDATFAVDHVSPDWNEQAAKAAASYLELMAFSRQELIDQLVFEGFTPEQAEFGVTAAGY